MDIFRINSLVENKKWTELLETLPDGEHKIAFRSVKDIKSCKAIAYDINSDKNGRNYRFRVDKNDICATIIVTENRV